METESRTLMASWDTPCAGSRVREGGPPLRSTEEGGKVRTLLSPRRRAGRGWGAVSTIWQGVSAAHFLRCHSAFLFT